MPPALSLYPVCTVSGCRIVRLNSPGFVLSAVCYSRTIRGPNILGDGHLLPSLFILLSNKSENIYGRMWEQIKILCPSACPFHLIVDFELAATNSFSP